MWRSTLPRWETIQTVEHRLGVRAQHNWGPTSDSPARAGLATNKTPRLRSWALFHHSTTLPKARNTRKRITLVSKYRRVPKAAHRKVISKILSIQAGRRGSSLNSIKLARWLTWTRYTVKSHHSSSANSPRSLSSNHLSNPSALSHKTPQVKLTNY